MNLVCFVDWRNSKCLEGKLGLAWNSKDFMGCLLSICIFCIWSELLREETVKSVLCVVLNIVFFQYALIFFFFFLFLVQSVFFGKSTVRLVLQIFFFSFFFQHQQKHLCILFLNYTFRYGHNHYFVRVFQHLQTLI